MEISTELIDLCAVMQDEVLDGQVQWLSKLPVSDEVRWEAFDHLCAATGALLDQLIALTQIED